MGDSILIVDDEQEIADLVEVYLRNENYRVLKFYNATDALQCVKAEKISLAILDVMLPDIDGFELCRRIRQEHRFPVIMLTAKEEELDKVWIKFYKVDKARTREYGGSGIGLSIVRAIMASHNRECGVINHESGVEFWCELDASAKGAVGR